MPNAYQQLTHRFQRLSRFAHLGAIAGWDMQAMMPPKGAAARSEALAELRVLRHQLLTEPVVGDWIAEAQTLPLSSSEQANLHEITRQYALATVLPGNLVEAQSLAGSRCEHAWRTLRASNDWASFEPLLKEVVSLAREEATLRAEATGVSRYDALLNLYEPGMSSAKLDTLFGSVKTWLPDLIQEIMARQASLPLVPPQGPFSTSLQRETGLDVMKVLGFDFEAGRLDISAHPFCGGVPDDVRITTRYSEDDLFSALFGVIHETGHARYEQNLPCEWRGQPVAEARSMGIHESQSLFFEMQVGRHPLFLKQLRTLVLQHFPQQPALEEDNFIAWNHRVTPGLIRVDADEVTYPAHVILRYEIERALMEGNIEVGDIPDLWNEKMQASLGLSTQNNYRDGCMQDIHWTDGSFGYFPTYTLGAMYAAQFMATIRQKMDIDEIIRTGDLTPVFDWLNNNIWNKGCLLATDELVKQATGESLNPDHFRQHLITRYL